MKSRLRSTLSQDHLEAFMLMATKKDVLMHLDTDTVINRVAEKTAQLIEILVKLNAINTTFEILGCHDTGKG